MAHVATVTIPAAASALSDFPVTITPTNAAAWNTFWATVTASGGDIRCYLDDDTTALPRDVVPGFDKTGKTGEIHVKVGSVSATLTTDIHIHADGSSTEPAFTDTTHGRNAVWGSYGAVFHLDDDPSASAPQVVDSTGNGHDGTSSGTMTDTDEVAAQIGNGLDFDGGDDSIEFSIPFNNVSAFTASAWVRRTTTTDNVLGRWVVANKNILWRENSGLQAFVRNAADSAEASVTTTYPDATWAHITFVADGSDIKASTNGGSFTTASFTGPYIPTVESDWKLGDPRGGSDLFTGRLDEVRFRASALSLDWIAYEHDNQSDPAGWYTVTDAGGGGATIPVLYHHYRTMAA